MIVSLQEGACRCGFCALWLQSNDLAITIFHQDVELVDIRYLWLNLANQQRTTELGEQTCLVGFRFQDRLDHTRWLYHIAMPFLFVHRCRYVDTLAPREKREIYNCLDGPFDLNRSIKAKADYLCNGDYRVSALDLRASKP